MSSSRSLSLVPGWYEFESEGVRQAYEIVGSGPVCVVHSGGPGNNSDNLRMPLLEQHPTMVYLDPIGTGRSDLLPGGDYSVSTYARFARSVIDHLGAKQPYAERLGGVVVETAACGDQLPRSAPGHDPHATGSPRSPALAAGGLGVSAVHQSRGRSGPRRHVTTR